MEDQIYFGLQVSPEIALIKKNNHQQKTQKQLLANT